MVGDIGIPRAMALCIRSKLGRMRWSGWYRHGVDLADYVRDITHSALSDEGINLMQRRCCRVPFKFCESQ